MEQSNPFLKFTLFALAFGFRPFKIPLFPFLSEVPGGQLSIKTLEQFYIYIYSFLIELCIGFIKFPCILIDILSFRRYSLFSRIFSLPLAKLHSKGMQI